MKSILIISLAVLMAGFAGTALADPTVSWSMDGGIPYDSGVLGGPPAPSSADWLIQLITTTTVNAIMAGTITPWGPAGAVLPYQAIPDFYPWTGEEANVPIGTNLSVLAFDGSSYGVATHFILSANTYTVSDPGDLPPGAQQFQADMNTTWQVIPEPGTFAMMGLGVAAIRFARWRRRRKAA